MQRKKNFFKHQKVSNYYDHGCLLNFLWLFRYLLTPQIVKNSHLLIAIDFFILKNTLDQTWKTFYYQIWKDTYEVRQVLALFYQLVAPKIVKQIKFKGVWGRVRKKNCLMIESWTKFLRQTLFFMCNRKLQEKFNFYFSKAFC